MSQFGGGQHGRHLGTFPSTVKKLTYGMVTFAFPRVHCLEGLILVPGLNDN